MNPAADDPAHDGAATGGAHVHPDDVPAGFAVRAPGWLPWTIWAFALLNLGSLFVAFDVVTLVVAVALSFAAATQQSWRAEVGPDGLRFRNRVGVDWERPWTDLRPDVVVRRPGRFGTLVRGRLRTGRRVSVPNGRVATLTGGAIAPETAQQLMQAWADNGTASTPGSGNSGSGGGAVADA